MSSPASKDWYVRIRDAVTGPFAPDELRDFARRGQLQPFHEVSRDRVAWQSAASLLGGEWPAGDLPPGAEAGEPAALPPRPSHLPRRRPALDVRTAFVIAAVGCLSSATLASLVTWGFTALGRQQLDQILRDQEAEREVVVKQLDAAHALRDRLTAQVTDLERGREAMKKKVDEAEARLKDRDRELDLANQKLAQARTDESERARGEMDGLKKESEDLQRQLAAARLDLERARQAAKPSNQRGAEADARKETALAARLEEARKLLGPLAARARRWQGLADGRDGMTPEEYFQQFRNRLEEFRQDLAAAERELPRLAKDLEAVRTETVSAARAEQAAASLDRTKEAGEAWQDVRKRLGRFAPPGR